MSGFVYLVSSGSYSDYTVECIFEREVDANAYVTKINNNGLLAKHERNVRLDYTPPNAQYKCVDPIQTCPGCGKYWNSPPDIGWSQRVEEIQWFAAGEMPVIERVRA